MDLLIVGGGFAGVAAALNAALQRDERGADATITLVSRDEWLCLRPRLYEAHPETLRSHLPPVLQPVGVEFVRGEVLAIDAPGHTVEVRDAHGTRTLRWDRMVLAAGSVLAPPPVAGVREHAFDIDTWDAAMRFDRRLAQGVESITIVGAGMCGIELACELRARIAGHSGADAAVRARVCLLERGPEAGEGFGVDARAIIAEALAFARVELITGADVARVKADTVELADGRRLDAEVTVITTGMAASPLARGLGVPLDALGRLPVDDSLRVRGVEHVFAAGDVAHAMVEFGNVSLMACQHARTMGKFAGGNALRDMLGLPLLAYCQTGYTTCLDLGDHGAVHTTGWHRDLKTAGMEAKQRKRWINRELIAPPAPGSGRAAMLAFGRIDPDTGR